MNSKDFEQAIVNIVTEHRLAVDEQSLLGTYCVECGGERGFDLTPDRMGCTCSECGWRSPAGFRCFRCGRKGVPFGEPCQDCEGG